MSSTRGPLWTLTLTQISNCVMTMLPLWAARCSALRPSASPRVSLTCCRDPWASSRTTARRSSSAVALSSCWPRETSAHGSDAKKSRCSYFARIQRSRSSLQRNTQIHTNTRFYSLVGLIFLRGTFISIVFCLFWWIVFFNMILIIIFFSYISSNIHVAVSWSCSHLDTHWGHGCKIRHRGQRDRRGWLWTHCWLIKCWWV